MIRVLAPILSFIFRNVLSGALWSLGAALVDAIHKKGLPMIRTPKLLFHPKITFGAFCACLATILGYAPEIRTAFGTRGLLFVIVCSVLLTIATYGRSPASAVDNNQVPK